MSNRHPIDDEGRAAPVRATNVRTALILVSIAVVFFGGIIVAQYVGGNGTGLSVLALAIVGFLLVAVGRNIRR